MILVILRSLDQIFQSIWLQVGFTGRRTPLRSKLKCKAMFRSTAGFSIFYNIKKLLNISRFSVLSTENFDLKPGFSDART